jgi:hypothetical protein
MRGQASLTIKDHGNDGNVRRNVLASGRDIGIYPISPISLSP